MNMPTINTSGTKNFVVSVFISRLIWLFGVDPDIALTDPSRCCDGAAAIKIP
jgi:hypothetical protein